jgi:hypothetical protein
MEKDRDVGINHVFLRKIYDWPRALEVENYDRFRLADDNILIS